MKKTIGDYFFAHLALMALGGVLLAGALVLQPGYKLSPLWTLSVIPMGGAAWILGKKFRPLRPDANRYWNAAMLFYLVSLALLFWLWRSKTLAAAVFNVWNFPCAPFLAGLDGWIGHIHVEAQFDYDLFYRQPFYQNTVLPILGVVSAAVEPLLFTLGAVGGRKNSAERDAEEKK